MTTPAPQSPATISDAPAFLNLNDRAMWVLGFNAAVEAAASLQVQEHAQEEELPRPRCDRCNDSGWWYSDPFDPGSLEPCCEPAASVQPHREAGEVQQQAREIAQLFRGFAKSSHRWHDGRPVHLVAAELLETLASLPAPVPAPIGWLYDWIHSSALGKPDEHFTGFTTDEAHARKHDNARPVYGAPVPADGGRAMAQDAVDTLTEEGWIWDDDQWQRPVARSQVDEIGCGGRAADGNEHFDREDVEAVADCLGDNMDRAASMLTWMLLTHPAYAAAPVSLPAKPECTKPACDCADGYCMAYPSGETLAQREEVHRAWCSLPDDLRKDARLTRLYHALGGPRMDMPTEALPVADCGVEAGEKRRTDKDYAIEHAGYMAEAARHLMQCMDHEFDASEALEAASAADAEDAAAKAEDLSSVQEDVVDARSTLQNRIYEFEKRRDRAAPKSSGAPDSKGGV